MPFETLETVLRVAGPLLLAAATAYVFDRSCARKGLLPPGFRVPWRRAAAFALLAGILYLGVFSPLGRLGLETEEDVTSIATPQLFLLHALLVATLAGWFLLGFSGVAVVAGGSGGLGRQLAAQLGLLAPRPWSEIGLGLALGIGAWMAVLAVIFAIAFLMLLAGYEELLPKRPPDIIPLIAGLPIAVRVLVSLSAGVVEELFFRGFLQPRMGIALSTICFALAHAAYGQPFLLVAVTLLSLIYGWLVRWRQSIWAAAAAHTLFDAVQLLVVIPAALRLVEQAPPALM